MMGYSSRYYSHKQESSLLQRTYTGGTREQSMLRVTGDLVREYTKHSKSYDLWTALL